MAGIPLMISTLIRLLYTIWRVDATEKRRSAKAASAFDHWARLCCMGAGIPMADVPDNNR